ncbi:SagB/ThcOx family dehydrogenase [Pandoraea communis]|nr:SagB/ThcOx family dehydrogenase [Pandoraea communis]
MTPTAFLKILNGKLILWNYLQHKQYEIDPDHIARLLELLRGTPKSEMGVDKDLAEAGLLTQGDPADWGWDCLSRIFHVGTQVPRTDVPAEEVPYLGYIEHCTSLANSIPPVEIIRPGPITPLPPPQTINTCDLGTALMQRATCRAFDGKAISLQEVANSLWATFGAIHGGSRSDLEEAGLMPIGYRRTSPSGGSMQASEPYLIAFNVTGLRPGTYHYRSIRHELSYISEAPSRENICHVLCNQTVADGLSYGVFITSRFDKLWWKYPHSRAYRVALMDVGCLIQTFQLVSAAQGIQSWPTGYFVDAEANSLLQVDGVTESTLFFLGAGYGTGAVAKDALTALQNFQKQKVRH